MWFNSSDTCKYFVSPLCSKTVTCKLLFHRNTCHLTFLRPSLFNFGQYLLKDRSVCVKFQLLKLKSVANLLAWLYTAIKVIELWCLYTWMRDTSPVISMFTYRDQPVSSKYNTSTVRGSNFISLQCWLQQRKIDTCSKFDTILNDCNARNLESAKTFPPEH